MTIRECPLCGAIGNHHKMDDDTTKCVAPGCGYEAPTPKFQEVWV